MADSNRGTYLLILHMETPHPNLHIGRLGQHDMAAGYYLYVGSAFGPGGLGARLAHHQQHTRRRPHWHIDYLRPHTHLCELWTLSGTQRMETTWCAALLNVPGLTMPVSGFGASDSTLPAHLFYVVAYPPCRVLSRILLTPATLSGPDTSQVRIGIHRFPSAAPSRHRIQPGLK